MQLIFDVIDVDMDATIEDVVKNYTDTEVRLLVEWYKKSIRDEWHIINDDITNKYAYMEQFPLFDTKANVFVLLKNGKTTKENCVDYTYSFDNSGNKRESEKVGFKMKPEWERVLAWQYYDFY